MLFWQLTSAPAPDKETPPQSDGPKNEASVQGGVAHGVSDRGQHVNIGGAPPTT